MGTRNFKALGKYFKLFLMIDFLILVLSFIGTAQFANEYYQLMSFGGFAAVFGWFFSLIYCALSVVVFVLLGIVLWRRNSILAVIAFFMQILIRLPSCLFYLLSYLEDGYLRHSWHNIVIFFKLQWGLLDWFTYFFDIYVHERSQMTTLKIDFRQGVS